MKLIKPSFGILEQQSGEVGMLKHIEKCGRCAYKSEDRTTEDSYIKFVDMLKGVKHGSVLEHGTVYLLIKDKSYIVLPLQKKYESDKYSKVKRGAINEYFGECYVTTNYRVLVEQGWLNDLKYQCEPTEFHEKRVSVRMICDIGVSREFNRHRTFSITEQSTRYCNFSKEQFGNELTFIIPCWLDENELADEFNCPNLEFNYHEDIEYLQKSEWSDAANFIQTLAWCEVNYLTLLKNGWKPQQARDVLPLSTKTEVIYTGFISDWKHFFSLRDTAAAHPQAYELAHSLHEKFKKLKLL